MSNTATTSDIQTRLTRRHAQGVALVLRVMGKPADEVKNKYIPLVKPQLDLRQKRRAAFLEALTKK